MKSASLSWEKRRRECSSFTFLTKFLQIFLNRCFFTCCLFLGPFPETLIFFKVVFSSFSVKQVIRSPHTIMQEVQQTFILMGLFIANLQQNGYEVHAVHSLMSNGFVSTSPQLIAARSPINSGKMLMVKPCFALVRSQALTENSSQKFSVCQ